MVADLEDAGFPENLDLVQMADVFASQEDSDLAEALLVAVERQYASAYSPEDWARIYRDLRDDMWSPHGWASDVVKRLLSISASVMVVSGHPDARVDYYDEYRIIPVAADREQSGELLSLVHLPEADRGEPVRLVAVRRSLDDLYAVVGGLLAEEYGRYIRDADPASTFWVGIPHDVLWAALDRVLGEAPQAWVEAWNHCRQQRSWVMADFIVGRAVQLLREYDDEADSAERLRESINLVMQMADEGRTPEDSGALELLKYAYWANWDANPMNWHEFPRGGD